MDKSEVIRVRVSASTLVMARAKTELTGEGLSGYIRRLLMVDLRRSVDIDDGEKKSEPAVSLDNVTWRDNLK